MYISPPWSLAAFLYILQSIIDEVSGTLSEKFRWSRQEIETFLTMGLKACLDPDDNHVLECAQSALADFLVIL